MRIVILFRVMARLRIRRVLIMLLSRREDGGLVWVGSRQKIEVKREGGKGNDVLIICSFASGSR